MYKIIGSMLLPPSRYGCDLAVPGTDLAFSCAQLCAALPSLPMLSEQHVILHTEAQDP